MPEFIGTENSIAIQKRLRDRQPEIAQSPHLVNGGRILHFLDPAATGWDTVRRLAVPDKLAGFPLVSGEAIVPRIREHLGPAWKTPVWHALTGAAEQVLSACQSVIGSIDLPGAGERRRMTARTKIRLPTSRP